MYIAFKWLLGLTLAMWLLTCCLDTFVKRNIIQEYKGYQIQANVELGLIKNKTVPAKTNKFISMNGKDNNMVHLHSFIFGSGLLIVLFHSRLNDLIINLRQELTKILTSSKAQKLQKISTITAIEIVNKSTIYLERSWETLKNTVYALKNGLSTFKFKLFQKQRINVLLLNKLEEIGQENKNLAQLLITAIRENKTIRAQYQLENLAKNRLLRHIENTQKVIKENRSRYVSFQQLYLVTHQENTFLKFRIKKLVQEKADADKDLLELMSEIYKSKNNELKSYCSRFLVKSKDNLLNSDAAGENKSFLREPHTELATSSRSQLNERPVIAVSSVNSWLKCSSFTQITEIVKDDVLEPLVSEAPKLKGLPGEYVWTVKDKDGVIEKLYEYDCTSDLDNGETIRRIRQYSVYHDKDCLLDFSNSSTDMSDPGDNIRSWGSSSHRSSDRALTSQRFLTGSEAFKKFMQNNKNVVSINFHNSNVGVPILMD